MVRFKAIADFKLIVSIRWHYVVVTALSWCDISLVLRRSQIGCRVGSWICRRHPLHFMSLRLLAMVNHTWWVFSSPWRVYNLNVFIRAPITYTALYILRRRSCLIGNRPVALIALLHRTWLLVALLVCLILRYVITRNIWPRWFNAFFVATTLVVNMALFAAIVVPRWAPSFLAKSIDFVTVILLTTMVRVVWVSLVVFTFKNLVHWTLLVSLTIVPPTFSCLALFHGHEFLESFHLIELVLFLLVLWRPVTERITSGFAIDIKGHLWLPLEWAGATTTPTPALLSIV